MALRKQISEGYSSLKDRIQERIKQLEGKVDPSITRLSLNSPSESQPSGFTEYSHCHLHHQKHYCNYSCHHSHNFHQPECDSERQDLEKDKMNQFFLQNLKIQQQINQNIRNLTQKLSGLESERKSSCQSQLAKSPFSENGSHLFRRKKKIDSSSQYTDRSKSKRGSISSKKKSNLQLTESKSQISNKRMQISGKEKNREVEQQYFGVQRRKIKCPIHSKDQAKEIYEKRKRKHVSKERKKKRRECNLNYRESFLKQEKSRKNLLAKIAKNFYEIHLTQ